MEQDPQIKTELRAGFIITENDRERHLVLKYNGDVYHAMTLCLPTANMIRYYIKTPKQEVHTFEYEFVGDNIVITNVDKEIESRNAKWSLTFSKRPKKFVSVVTNDNVTFTITHRMAQQFIVIKDILDINEDAGSLEEPIPLLNIDSEVFKIILDYYAHHEEDYYVKKEYYGEDLPPSDDIDDWDVDFLEPYTVGEGTKMLERIVTAASYLIADVLYEVCCKTYANLMRGKNIDELRKILHITNDFTPEEEAEFRAKFEWALKDS